MTSRSGLGMGSAPGILVSWENTITAAAATDATQAVRGMPFIVYNEDCCSDVIRNIQPERLAVTVSNIARKRQIPDNIRDKNLLLCNTPVMNEFKFNINSNSSTMFVFCRFAMVKQPNGCTDIAYSICSLNYKLSPNAVQTHMNDVHTFIEFTTDVRTFPCHDQWVTYFRHRVIDHFSERYPHLL